MLKHTIRNNNEFEHHSSMISTKNFTANTPTIMSFFPKFGPQQPGHTAGPISRWPQQPPPMADTVGEVASHG